MPGDIYVSFGADTSELEASMAVAKAQVSALNSEMRDLTQQFNDTGASADSDLGQQMVALGGKLNEAKGHATVLKEELKGVGKSEGGEEERLGLFERMKETLEMMVSPIVELQNHFAEMIEIFAAAFAVEKIAEWATETSEAFERIESDAAKLGVSVEQVQQLQAVAQLSGTDYGELTQQFERLQLSLARAGAAATPAGAALKALGLDLAAFRAESITQQIDTLAGAFSRFADGPAKTAIATALGKSFADMIPILDKGREGMEELNAVAERTGIVFSADMVAAMAKTREDISELSLAWTAASREIYAAFNPVIDALVVAMNRFLETLTVNRIRAWTVDGVEAFGEIAKAAIDGFESIRVGIAETINLFERMGSVVSAVAGAVSGAIDKIAAAVEGVRRALDELHNQTAASDAGAAAGSTLGGMLAGRGHSGAPAGYGGMENPSGGFGSGDFAEQAQQFQFEGALAAQRLKAGVDGYTKSLSDLFAHSKGDVEHATAAGASKPQAPQLDLGGAKAAKDASEAVRLAYDSEVQAAKEAAQETETTLNGVLQRHQMTTSQWLQQSLAALDKEQDAIQDAADKAIASAGLTANQKTQIANREAQELAQIANKVAQDQNKAAEETAKSFQTAFNQINSAFDAQVDGLLKGTTSWAQAVKNVLATLTEDVIKFALNWTLKQAEAAAQSIATDNAATAAHVAGNAVKTASDSSSAAAGGLAWIGNALKAIAADAAQAFGGVFAFLAPILGPAAAGPAAAASASVMAAGGAVASADIGMWSVPNDQLALVHHNELIMPAAQAGAFRNLLSGGAGEAQGRGAPVHATANFNISAIDGRSVVQHLNWNRGAAAKMMRDAVRSGAMAAHR